MDRKHWNRRCKNCGELELVGEGAEFGWFTDTEDKTWCMRCGLNPLRKATKRELVKVS